MSLVILDDTCGNAREPSEEESGNSVKPIAKSGHLRRENVLGTPMLQSKLTDVSHPDYHAPMPGRPIPTTLEVYNPVRLINYPCLIPSFLIQLFL